MRTGSCQELDALSKSHTKENQKNEFITTERLSEKLFRSILLKMKYLLGMETIYTDLEEVLSIEMVNNIMNHHTQVMKYLFNMMSTMLMDLLGQLNLHLVH